jgi:ABC-2 type transport system permease protein
MPEWLQTAHQFLPIEPMAQLVRAGLASDDFVVPGRSMVVLGVWVCVAVAAALIALRRRA